MSGVGSMRIGSSMTVGLVGGKAELRLFYQRLGLSGTRQASLARRARLKQPHGRNAA